jgi:beta-lactamase class D
MNKRLFSSVLLFLAACTAPVVFNPAQVSTPNPTPAPTVMVSDEVKPELEEYFQGFTGAFVLLDFNNHRMIRYNPLRCDERFIPASTFKILNSLIALESGVIPDENTTIHWDGTKYAIAAWNQDHTLKTAIQNSVVWYYQELARRVGNEQMQHYVDLANYGNKDISGKIDSFWLDGGLRISADEQVAFLQRLYQNDLPFSARTIKIVKEILLLEKNDNYQLSGKSGSAQRNTLHTGWFVGYLETNGNVYYFATNIESTNPDGLANGGKAQEINMNILRGLGLLQQIKSNSH